MDIGFLGLGRMGENMVRRLTKNGHHVVAWNRSRGKIDEVAAEGADPAYTVEELISKLSPRRAIWLMLPAGEVIDQTIAQLLPQLSKGDVIVDGGNSNFHDSIRRGTALKEQGIGFLDAGVSGGIWGLSRGYCTMAGGEDDDFALLEPAIKSLAPEGGYLHTGPVGSGHFTKMVHNGIEYGMLQAYGEGFEIMKKSQFPLDLGAVANLWNHSSVVTSWLLELLVEAYKGGGNELADIRGYVEDSGEGRWTVLEAINESVPAPVITLALLARFTSRQDESYSAKVVAALRNQFGGHAVKLESGETSGVKFAPSANVSATPTNPGSGG